MSNEVIKDDKLNYILVEGPDDAQAFFHLLRIYGLHTQVTIQQKEGIGNLLESLEVELKRRAETRHKSLSGCKRSARSTTHHVDSQTL